MAELSRRLRDSAKQSKTLRELMNPELAKALKNDPGNLSKAMLEECRMCSAKAGRRLKDKLTKLAKAGLLDAKAADKVAILKESDLKQALGAVKKQVAEQKLNGGNLMTMIAQCTMAGKGGVTRGRGDAPLTWKDPTAQENIDFSEKVLTPSAFNGLADSELKGFSAAAPGLNDTGQSGDTGQVLKAQKQTGGGAAKHTVLPRHRRVVERYFERE